MERALGAVLVGPNNQVRPRLHHGSYRQLPLRHVPRVVGKVVSGQIHRRRSAVEQLNPIGMVARFVHDGRGVCRHEFVHHDVAGHRGRSDRVEVDVVFCARWVVRPGAHRPCRLRFDIEPHGRPRGESRKHSLPPAATRHRLYGREIPSQRIAVVHPHLGGVGRHRHRYGFAR